MLALLAVTFVLGQATSPPEEVLADPTSTTSNSPIVAPTTTTTVNPETFSVRDIAMGDTFIWLHAPPLPLGWPIEMLEHEGSVYLFATSMTPQGSTHGGGLEALVVE